VSGFSAWLTPRELEAMAMYPWFVEAVPDKSYKLLSVETPMPQLSGDGEGVIIGLLDAGGVPSIPEAEGMPPPPAKWKGRCDHSKACNNNLIGPRSFVDTNRSQGTVMSSASGGSMHRVPSPGVVDYATAFAVAPKAHLAIYRVCDEVVCDPKAVAAGMDAAVDDSMDVVTLLIGNDEDNTVFRDEDAVSVPSYEAVARGVLVCAPAGSSGPDMYRVESDAPWLLTVAASDTDRRAVTNVELGNGILKPDVSAPGLMSTTESLPHGVVKGSDANLKKAASVAAAHVSGVAAMIKKAHPEWSPPVIKSALVTTALPVRTVDALTGDHAGSYFVVACESHGPRTRLRPRRRGLHPVPLRHEARR
jgi:subtilisin family serine protease